MKFSKKIIMIRKNQNIWKFWKILSQNSLGSLFKYHFKTWKIILQEDR